MKAMLTAGVLVFALIVAGAWGSLRGADSVGPAQQIAELQRSVEKLRIQVRALQERVEKLEAVKPATVQVVPGPKPSPPAPNHGGDSPLHLLQQVPKNWQPLEFNGMTYYLVPLKQN